MAHQQSSTTTRLILLAPLAAGLTFSLFVFMQTLIRSDVIVIEETAGIPDIRINWVPKEIEPIHETTIEDIEEVVEPPVINPIEFPDDGTQTPDDNGVFSGRIVEVDTGINREEISLVVSRVPTPVYRLEPEYPRSEANRGMEGACTVHFDILASGETANIRTSRCDTSGFARASTRAVASWRYTENPDLSPDRIFMRNASVTLTYTMED